MQTRKVFERIIQYYLYARLILVFFHILVHFKFFVTASNEPMVYRSERKRLRFGEINHQRCTSSKPRLPVLDQP